MSARDRLAALDDLPAVELCRRTGDCLDELARVMNTETGLLREGRFRDAAQVTALKIELAQDYTSLVRAVQRQSARLLREAPRNVQDLRQGHEKLATQMADNLRVLATARTVTEGLLQDVSRAVGKDQRAQTYGPGGTMESSATAAARGIALNRAL